MAYKILHCLSFMNRGGAETFIMNLFRNINREQYSFDFLLNSDEGHYIEEIKNLGGKVHVIPTRSQGWNNYCKKLDIFFATHLNEYDAVHLHTSSLSSLEILFYAKKYGIKTRIIHSHNTNQAGLVHHILHYFNKPFLKYLATNYLACSRVAKDWMFSFTSVNKHSVVINNGINTSLFAYSDSKRKCFRNEFSIADDTFVIGHVGRFDKVKNHTFLLKVFNEILKINKNSVLILVGDGELKTNVLAEAESLGILQKVIFAGIRSDIDVILSGLDVFVFPSLYEGLPVSLIEAQASGIPVVVSENVSPEVKLSENLKFLPLNATCSYWASTIVDMDHVDRIKEGKIVDSKGYGIKETINFLTTQIYK